MSTVCGRPQGGFLPMWTHVDRGRGGQKRDFFVDVINGWPPMSVAPLQANYYSEAFQTQDTDVSEFDAEAPQATASEELAQGPYVAAKTGLKPTTFQTKGVESTNEPPCPTIISLKDFHCCIACLLRHCCVLGFDCLLRCLFRHYTTSSSRACFNMQ